MDDDRLGNDSYLTFFVVVLLGICLFNINYLLITENDYVIQFDDEYLPNSETYEIFKNNCSKYIEPGCASTWLITCEDCNKEFNMSLECFK